MRIKPEEYRVEEPPVLMPYQEDGVRFLLQCTSALLHWDQGAGKTYPAAQAAGEVIEDGVCIWIAPRVTCLNAKREIEAVHGSRYTVKVIEKSSDRLTGAAFYILSYDLVNRDNVYEQLMELSIDGLVLDESQYLKNNNSKRTRRILGHNGLASRARRVWGLSGTPCPNHIGEIYPWIASRHPEVIAMPSGQPMNYYRFIDAFCHVVETPFGNRIVGSNVKAGEQLWDALRDVVSTIRKEDVLHDLPECRFAQVEVAGDKTAREVRALEAKHREELEAVAAGVQGSDAADMHLTTVRRSTEMSKVGDAIGFVRDELAHGGLQKIVIFANFIDTIDALLEGLSEFGALGIHGSVTPKKRQEAIDAFQSSGDVRVIVGQTIAAGTGITLHAHGACQDVLFIGADWVPANNAQAVARVHRKGQRNAVTARFLHLSNSIDEAIQKTLMHKSRQINTIYGKEVQHHAA